MRTFWILGLTVAVGCSAQNDSRYAAVELLDLPVGARVLTPASPPAAGPATRVGTEACVPGSAGADVADAIKSALAAHWNDVRVLPSGDRWVVVGQKDGLGVSGTVDAAHQGSCAAGEIYVNLGVHEIPADGRSRYVGARGPRAAAAGRLPVVPVAGPMPTR